MQRALFLLTSLLNKFSFGVALLFIAREVSPALFGEFSSNLSITNLLLALSSLGLIEYFLISYPSRLSWAINNLLIWFSLTLLIVLALAYLFSNSLLEVLLWALIMKTFVQLITSICQVQEKFILAACIQIYVILTLILSLVLFNRMEYSLSEFLQLNIVLNIPIVLTLSLLVDFKRGFFSKLDKQFYSKSTRFSLSISLAYIYMSSDVVMLNYLASSFDAGIYSAATSIIFVTYLILDVLYRYYLPIYSLNVKSLAKAQYIDEYIKLLLLTVTPICLLVIFFHGEIIDLVYSASYADAAKYMIPLAIVLVMHSLCFPLGMVISAHGLQKEKNIIQLKVAAINILVNLILIPQFNIYGAILATIISEVFLLTSYYLVVQKVNGKLMCNKSVWSLLILAYILIFGLVKVLITNSIIAVSLMFIFATLFLMVFLTKTSILNMVPR